MLCKTIPGHNQSTRKDIFQMTPKEDTLPSFTCALKSFTYIESIFRIVFAVSVTALRTASSILFSAEAITSITFTIAIQIFFSVNN